MFADALYGKHHLILSDFIHRVDMVRAFHPIQIPLVNTINANIPRLSPGSRFASFTDRMMFGGCRFRVMATLMLIACAGAQLVEV